MADPAQGIAKQLKSEGPYDPPDNPSDPGGETVWGIDWADNHDPNDPITTALWLRLEWLKKNSSFPVSVSTDGVLLATVNQFYTRLWNSLSLGILLDQDFANELFGAYNNQGPKVVFWLQKCLNALNYSHESRSGIWPMDLPMDGVLGPATAARINQLIGTGDSAYIKDSFASFRKQSFIESAAAFPARREETRGLFNRVQQGG